MFPSNSSIRRDKCRFIGPGGIEEMKPRAAPKASAKTIKLWTTDIRAWNWTRSEHAPAIRSRLNGASAPLLVQFHAKSYEPCS